MMRAAVILMILLAVRSSGSAAPVAAMPAPAGLGAADCSVSGCPTDDADEVDGAIAGGDDAALAGPHVPVVGPPIGAVLSAAYATAGLDRDPQGSWIRRARLGGLVPWVTVRTARDTSWQDEHSEVGHGTSLEVRATWRLDRLLFDSHELQIASMEAARRRERRRLATRVIRSYFAWRRAAAVDPGAGDDGVAMRVAETAAELDALTDGWFSGEVSRLRSGASGTRARRTPAP